MLGGIIFLVIISAAVILFLQRGRSYGISALSARTQELHTQGVTNVYLLHSTGPKGPLDKRGPSYFLAYSLDGKFNLENPWWKNMRPAGSWTPGDGLKIESNDKPMSAWKSVPGINIANTVGVVSGINITDIQEIKESLSFKTMDNSVLEANRTALVNELRSLGFST